MVAEVMMMGIALIIRRVGMASIMGLRASLTISAILAIIALLSHSKIC